MAKKLYINYKNQDYRTSYFKSPPDDLMVKLGWEIMNFKTFLSIKTDDFTKYLIDENIKVILCFNNYGNFINECKEFLLKNNIYILIYSNDLHCKNNIINSKKFNLNKMIHDLDNIYICANYYYCYLQFYNIDLKRIIKYPAFVDEDYYVNFNSNPINKILLSGTKTKEYPARKKLNAISGYNNNIDVIKNTIYLGHDFIKYLNKYLCCFTCCLNKSIPYIIGKFFEIPSSGSLLLAYDEFVKDELINLGFIDGVNYISCSLNNIEDKIEYILNPDNLKKINEIRKNGYEFVWKYHTQSDRLKYIDNFVNDNLINFNK